MTKFVCDSFFSFSSEMHSLALPYFAVSENKNVSKIRRISCYVGCWGREIEKKKLTAAKSNLNIFSIRRWWKIQMKTGRTVCHGARGDKPCPLPVAFAYCRPRTCDSPLFTASCSNVLFCMRCLCVLRENRGEIKDKQGYFTKSRCEGRHPFGVEGSTCALLRFSLKKSWSKQKK